MAQATTTAPPAKYGSAYAQIIGTAAALTDDQVDQLNRLYNDWLDSTSPEALYERVDTAIELFRPVDELHILLEPLAAVDAADAVLARDRGVITAGDFDTLTEPWVAAGLPLPAAITGDAEPGPFAPIMEMTSDRIADELLHAAHGTAEYGAVVMLTGYNYGELLAYTQIRCFFDPHDGQLKVDWDSLAHAVDHADLDDLTEDAHQFLEATLSLSPATATTRTYLDAPKHNAETVVLGVAHAFGLQHMIDPRWDTAGTPARRRPSPETGAARNTP